MSSGIWRAFLGSGLISGRLCVHTIPAGASLSPVLLFLCLVHICGRCPLCYSAATWNSLSHGELFRIWWNFLFLFSYFYLIFGVHSHLFKSSDYLNAGFFLPEENVNIRKRRKIAMSCVSSLCGEWTCSLFFPSGTYSRLCCPETSQISETFQIQIWMERDLEAFLECSNKK